MSPNTESITIADDVITPTKRRGRPKGSKNKTPLSTDGLKGDEPIQISDSVAWVIGAPSDEAKSQASWYGEDPGDYVSIRLQSEQVPDGLEATVSRYIAVAVSALPNGNASVITNIGSTQPLILVTVEPYIEVRNKFFPVLK